jgi:uncharacterized protein
MGAAGDLLGQHASVHHAVELGRRDTLPHISRTIAVVAICGWLTMGSASGQVRPCPFAATPQEAFVCSDPDLARLRQQLEARFLEASAALSHRGQAQLEGNQNAWRKFVTIVCARTETSNEKECLARAYSDQLKVLGQAAQRLGPFVFTIVQRLQVQKNYDTSPTPIGPDDQPLGLRVINFSYPQIDNAESPEAKAWNIAIAQQGGNIGNDCEAGQSYQSYEIRSATSQAISVVFSTWQYCQGAAHGMYGGTSSNLYLDVPPRPIALDAFFIPGTPWRQFLTDWATHYLKTHVNGTGQPYSAESIAAIAPAWGDSWSMTATGLDILHEAGPYALGEQDIETPWADLKPFLCPDAPLPR